MWKNIENGMLRKTAVSTFDLGDDSETNGMKLKITRTRKEKPHSARSGTTSLMIKSIRSNKSGAIVTNHSRRSSNNHPAVKRHPGKHRERSTIEPTI
jgi:hypothetical protein